MCTNISLNLQENYIYSYHFNFIFCQLILKHRKNLEKAMLFYFLKNSYKAMYLSYIVSIISAILSQVFRRRSREAQQTCFTNNITGTIPADSGNLGSGCNLIGKITFVTDSSAMCCAREVSRRICNVNRARRNVRARDTCTISKRVVHIYNTRIQRANIR